MAYLKMRENQKFNNWLESMESEESEDGFVQNLSKKSYFSDKSPTLRTEAKHSTTYFSFKTHGE
jgi:hypothetical protein